SALAVACFTTSVIRRARSANAPPRALFVGWVRQASVAWSGAPRRLESWRTSKAYLPQTEMADAPQAIRHGHTWTHMDTHGHTWTRGVDWRCATSRRERDISLSPKQSHCNSTDR